MKIIKSKGGYFYKIYKNGKKKRISEKEYLKIKLKNTKKKNYERKWSIFSKCPNF